MSSSSSTPKPKHPFQSLTTENPLCDLEDGGCGGYLELLREQACWLKNLIQLSKRQSTPLTDGEYHYITVTMTTPLFSENHNILANKGYTLFLEDYYKYRICWKCPNLKECKPCKDKSEKADMEDFL